MKPSISRSFTPFVAQLGVEMVHAGIDRSELRLSLEPRHLNGLDVAHGGLIMTLLDAAMGAAARAKDPDGRGVVTIEMKTSFLRPARGVLSAFGFCDHHSASLAFCRGELRDASHSQDLRVKERLSQWRNSPPRPSYRTKNQPEIGK